jgi:hypothetical protein
MCDEEYKAMKIIHCHGSSEEHKSFSLHNHETNPFEYPIKRNKFFLLSTYV